MRIQRAIGFVLAVALIGLFAWRIERRPVYTCDTHRATAGGNTTCAFHFMIGNSPARLCLRLLGEHDFLECNNEAAGLGVLPVRIPPPRSGPLVVEGVSINTRQDPPLASPSHAIGFVPDSGRPMWWNDLWLIAKRVSLVFHAHSH